MFKRTCLLIIILLANPFMNMASADDFSNVVGYKDALKGDGFPPPISEIINAIGKTDKLRIAILR